MSLTINTNSSAATATMHLSKNNAALKKSLNRLSSGTRIVQPVDDAGGLAVSMKLESSILRLAELRRIYRTPSRFWKYRTASLVQPERYLTEWLSSRD